jgi:hypothetical protein
MRAFHEWLTGKHECECGAVYKVTVSVMPFPNNAIAVSCNHCGRTMDYWRKWTGFRSYELISSPPAAARP